MPAKKKTSKTRAAVKPPARAAAAARRTQDKRRFWLTYPPKEITRPVIWEMSQKFAVIFNVRQASVTDEIGILCLELEGDRPEIKAVISWLEKHGVKVEPVEINVIDG